QAVARPRTQLTRKQAVLSLGRADTQRDVRSLPTQRSSDLLVETCRNREHDVVPANRGAVGILERGSQLLQDYPRLPDWREQRREIGRAHVRTPVTCPSRIASSARTKNESA